MYAYFLIQYWMALRKETLKPTQSGGKSFSMSQFRRLYNTVRIPGEELDQMVCYFKTGEEVVHHEN